jgi:hypothetical protein
VLGITAVIPKRSATAGSLLLLLGAMAIVPVRVRVSQTLFQMPEYGVLVDASRRIAALGQPMRAIATEFRLPPTADPTFVFRILGGRIDRGSPWVATIERTGSVTYRKAGAP